MLANGKDVNFLMLNGEVFAKTYDDIIGKKISVPEKTMMFTQNTNTNSNDAFKWNLVNHNPNNSDDIIYRTDEALKILASNCQATVLDWFMAKTSRNHTNQDKDNVVDMVGLWFLARIKVRNRDTPGWVWSDGTRTCWVRAKDVEIIES